MNIFAPAAGLAALLAIRPAAYSRCSRPKTSGFAEPFGLLSITALRHPSRFRCGFPQN